MILTGSKVYLRLLAWEDTADIVRWRNDPQIHSQLFSVQPPTRAEHEAWFKKLQAQKDRQEFVICETQTHLPLGTIGLSQIDLAERQAEYGILIGEANWRGKGMAFEASELILCHAFETLNLTRVVLNVFADNTLAIKLYQRLGFATVLGKERTQVKDGAWRRILFMQLEKLRLVG